MSIVIKFIICLSVGVIGQVLVKMGTNNLKQYKGLIETLVQNILVNPFLLLGLILYAFSMFLYINILTYIDLSKAAPIMSLSYIFVLFAGYFFFSEHISFIRIIGVVLIILGVYFISRS